MFKACVYPYPRQAGSSTAIPLLLLLLLLASGLVLMAGMLKPDDVRTKWFEAQGIRVTAPVGRMPLLEDLERPNLNPRGGTRPMRDDYNSRTPLTLMMDGVWLIATGGVKLL